MDVHQASILTDIDVLIFAGTAVTGFVSWLYLERRKRRMLQRMLFVEICSFVAVVKTTRLEEGYLTLIEHPPKRWQYASQENYFKVFEENAGSLGLFDAATVGHVVACYTFMKGARDARRAAASTTGNYVDVCRSELVRSAVLLERSLREAHLATTGMIKRDGSLKTVMGDILKSQSIEDLADVWRQFIEAKPLDTLVHPGKAA